MKMPQLTCIIPQPIEKFHLPGVHMPTKKRTKKRSTSPAARSAGDATIAAFERVEAAANGVAQAAREVAANGPNSPDAMTGNTEDIKRPDDDYTGIETQMDFVSLARQLAEQANDKFILNLTAAAGRDNPPRRSVVRAYEMLHSPVVLDHLEILFRHWHMPTVRPTFAELLELVGAHTGPSRCMELTEHHGYVDARVDFHLMATTHPVRVLIGEGTTKLEALTQLRHFIEFLEDEWEAAIRIRNERGLSRYA